MSNIVFFPRAGRDFSSTVLIVCASKCDSGPRQVDDVEARLWAELRGFQLFETSAATGEGVNDLFHAFFSQIVRASDDGANGLPRTPSSARRVQMSASSSSVRHSKSSGHVTSPASSSFNSSSNKEQALRKEQQPSAEQRTVMGRLREGHDPWQQLGLKRGCSQDDVNKVFRRLAMLLHPDKTAVAGADEAFKILGSARRTILRSMGAVA